MILRFENDRENFLDDMTAAEVSVTTPTGTYAFQFGDEYEALNAMSHFHRLASVYEKIIADLEEENAALKDDLAEAKKNKPQAALTAQVNCTWLAQNFSKKLKGD